MRQLTSLPMLDSKEATNINEQILLLLAPIVSNCGFTVWPVTPVGTAGGRWLISGFGGSHCLGLHKKSSFNLVAEKLMGEGYEMKML